MESEKSVPSRKEEKKNRGFGKKQQTVYDSEGHWTVFQHQDDLRKIDNKCFTLYYRDVQKLVPAAQWDSLMDDLRSPLPTTVWINDTDPLSSEVSRYMSALDSKLVEPISWYPVKGMAWRILADKTTFRKLPEMQPLRQYLIKQTALGTISRQEEVSMIPPFLLDIQANDVCLDMCASPGSKTAQMLVALGRHKGVPLESSASPFPFDYLSNGLVMANELDTKRANMLVHQVKRLRLLFPFALFCNHDARYFPDVMMKHEGSELPAPLRFDKILCDVVCSGDGTIRKAPYIFKAWSPREAVKLQKTQVHIALRACHLLKVGGRLVYSTCSLNPIENEAVVCQIAARTSGAMKLVDARSILPGLKCDPGMNTWQVTNGRGEVINEPDENFHHALFPPTNPIEGLDLALCMRLLPHHCNGGGFFIAVFDKVSPFQITPKLLKEADVDAAAEVVGEKRPRKDQKPRGKQTAEPVLAEATADTENIAPVKEKVPPQFLAATEGMVQSLKAFYEIPSFPTANLVSRAGNGERALTVGINTTASLVSKTALEILQQKGDNLIIVSAGLRVLAHENLDKGWRIASEAASLFAKLMRTSSRKLRVNMETVSSMITGGKLKEILLQDITDVALAEALEALPVGTVLLEIECPTAPGGFFYSVALRARSRIQLLVDHEDLVGMKLRLGLNLEEGELAAEGE